MTLNIFQNAQNKKETIINYARDNYETKLAINNFTCEHINYVYDNEFKYFLSTQHWNTLYNNMLNSQLFTKGQEFKLLNNQENIRLTQLKTVIFSNLNEVIFEDEVLKGRPVKVKELYDTLKIFITENNIEDYALILFHKIEDIITNALIKNELTSNFELELPETSLNNSLGITLFNSYFYSLKSYISIINAKNSKDIDLFQDFFTFIFDLYNNNSEKLSVMQYTTIAEEIKTKFNLDINNKILIDFICRKTIIFVIKKILVDPYAINYIGIKNYFNQLEITDNQLNIIENVLNSSLTINNVLLGSIIVNKLIENDIFEVFDKPKYTQKKGAINKPIGQTTFTIRIKHDLIYDMTLNSANFKPFLVENNQKEADTEFKVYRDNLVLNFKLSAINKKIHINKTGKGSFNLESLFAKNLNISNIQLSIDTSFLSSYLLLLNKISGKRLEYFNKVDILNAFSFLSIYGINFHTLLSTLPLEYKTILEDIIAYSLDFQENIGNIKIEHIVKNISTITNNINIKTQLRSILHKIRAYKIMLILALQEYILYSCFNYCIMPSYFDFRGRRYFIGSAFNIQSYPFLKAFVKIYELDEKLITDDMFVKLRENMLIVIKDEKLKMKISEKMFCYKKYKEHISINILKFLYSHIDECKITFELFKNLVNEESDDFLHLYTKILSIIKKANKALIITSYILLERRKHNNIINYANNYSYDMVTSGYQQAALLFPTQQNGIISNLIGDGVFDLYLDIGEDSKRCFLNCIKLFDEIFITVSDKLKSIHQTAIDYNILLPLLDDQTLCNLILDNKTIILSQNWILFTKDKSYLEDHYLSSTIEIMTCILIVGRISFLKNTLENNPWLLEKNVIGSRGLMKHIIMIELYGGTRRGRENAYKQFITETCMDIGIFFKNNKDMYNMFYFIENHYQLYKTKNLQGTQKIIKLAKTLGGFGKIVIIKNPNFICQLAPTKFVTDKRIRINSLRIKINRKPYQLNVNRPQFSNFKKLSDSSLIINKNKLVTLFPPNFIHSMDAMVPQIAILKVHNLNETLKNIDLRFNLISIHDNLSLGRLLFPVLPELLIDIYKEMFDYNYLNTLKDNFSENEFKLFMSIMKIKNGFTKDEINNPNMMKYG